jgi:hypothetical protein
MKLTMRIDPTGQGTVLLDDVDISSSVTAVEFKSKVGELTSVRVSLLGVEIDAEADVTRPEVQGAWVQST